MSGVIAAIIVIISMESMAHSFKFIPNACLAAIIIVAVIPLIDYQVGNVMSAIFAF